MRKVFKIILILIFGIFSNNYISAQGALCSDIEPFCAGDQRLTFPNSNENNSNQITGESGPDYGCLDEQPYPAWFFLQVENAGSLRFRISQTTNSNGTGIPLDVDFVVWGPFERGDEYCSGASLSSDKIVDCSYLPDAVETMTIPQAQANDIYVVVITNFDLFPGFISLEQVNEGGGSTDCSILDLDLGDTISVCDEAEYTLDGTTADASKYEWFVYNDSNSQFEAIPGEDGPTLTVFSTGRYKLVVTDEIEGKTEEDDVLVTFYNSPKIGEVSSLAVCDPNAEFIDLTENFEDLILPNNGDSSDYRVLYYETLEDVANQEPINQPQSFPFKDDKTIFAEVVDLASGCKSEIEEFELTIFDFPEFDIPEISIFCVDKDMQLLRPVNLGQDLGEGYFYSWRDGNTIISENPKVQFNQLPESSQITVTINHPESGCEIEFISTVAPISVPENVLVEVSGSDFGDGYTVTAGLEAFLGEEYASFVYRLDNGNWQDSNSFTEVPPGNHTVSVRELNGCGSATSESFFLVGYPRFFTPNSDGYNDNWNLITDSNISIKKLFVFDRYGKLITKIDPANKGWDGTYNGSDLPSDDYWFRVEFIDEKTGKYQEYMANFTLMR